MTLKMDETLLSLSKICRQEQLESVKNLALSGYDFCRLEEFNNAMNILQDLGPVSTRCHQRIWLRITNILGRVKTKKKEL